MNIQQTRQAQNAIRNAIKICEAKGGLVKAANVANQAWIDAGFPFPLPAAEYRRYSWLLADLTRIQMQLAAQLTELELSAGYPVDEENGTDTREFSGKEIEAAHAEALEVDLIVDDAVSISKVFADSLEYSHYSVNKSVDRTRATLVGLNRYNPKFIVKMMISVSRLAWLARDKAVENYRAMMKRCEMNAGDDAFNEIPF